MLEQLPSEIAPYLSMVPHFPTIKGHRWVTLWLLSMLKTVTKASRSCGSNTCTKDRNWNLDASEIYNMPSWCESKGGDPTRCRFYRAFSKCFVIACWQEWFWGLCHELTHGFREAASTSWMGPPTPSTLPIRHSCITQHLPEGPCMRSTVTMQSTTTTCLSTTLPLAMGAPFSRSVPGSLCSKWLIAILDWYPSLWLLAFDPQKLGCRANCLLSLSGSCIKEYPESWKRGVMLDRQSRYSEPQYWLARTWHIGS